MKPLICLLSLCLAASAALAQTPQPAADPTPGTVHLSVAVTSRSGEPVAGLPQSDFSVLDEGKPQAIQSFTEVAGKDAVTRVFLVIDAVNIPYVQLAYERNQLETFLHSNDGRLTQPTSLVIFSDTKTEATGFTTDGNVLGQILDQKEIGLREVRRSAGFYGAEERFELSIKAIQELLAQTEKIPGRKAIVWVSPGWPLLSGPAVQLTGRQEQQIFDLVVQLSTEMRQNHVTLFSVDPLGAQQSPAATFYYETFLNAVRKPSQALPGNAGLQVLAIQSGGLALNSSNDIRALLQRCMDATKSSYEITYTRPLADKRDEYHKVEVKVAAPGLTAHTIQGYYAQPGG